MIYTTSVSDLPAKFAVTIFQDRFAFSKSERQFTLGELAELIRKVEAPSKDRLPLFKPARFGEVPTGSWCLRHDGNVLEITGIIAEHDRGDVQMDDAVLRLACAGIPGLFYTSPSNRLGDFRWRVVAPLSQPLPPDRHGALVNYLNSVLRGCLAHESWTLSQSYYFGRNLANETPFRVHVVEPEDGGYELDVLARIDNALDDPRSETSTTDWQCERPAVSVGNFTGKRRPTEWWRTLAAGEIGDKHRTKALCSFAGLLMKRGYEPAEYLRLLPEFNAEKCTPMLSDAKVLHTARGIWHTHQRRAGASH